MNKKRTVKEVVDYLKTIDDERSEEFQDLLKDERKGIQQAISNWRKGMEQKNELVKKYKEMSYYEEEAVNKGFFNIAGIDEVGRGPLAGPVLAACVVLDHENPILGLDDSKKLSEKKRNHLYQEIKEKAITFGVGQVSAAEIDEYNILEATKLAMVKAIEEASNHLIESGRPSIQFALVDAVNLNYRIEQKVIEKGDQKSISIAAASILAKVERDRYMRELDQEYPQYGFKNNVGYGTSKHIEAIKEHGICEYHRRSFAPVKKYSN